MHQNIIDALLAAWNEGDYDGLDAVVDQSAVRRSPASVGSDADGLAELKDVIRTFRTQFPDARVDIDEIQFVGDRSYARWTFTGTNTGPGDFPATGKPVSIQGASHARYAGGKLTEELVFFDGMEMLGQLGLVDLPGADA